MKRNLRQKQWKQWLQAGNKSLDLQFYSCISASQKAWTFFKEPHMYISKVFMEQSNASHCNVDLCWEILYLSRKYFRCQMWQSGLFSKILSQIVLNLQYFICSNSPINVLPLLPQQARGSRKLLYLKVAILGSFYFTYGWFSKNLVTFGLLINKHNYTIAIPHSYKIPNVHHMRVFWGAGFSAENFGCLEIYIGIELYSIVTHFKEVFCAAWSSTVACTHKNSTYLLSGASKVCGQPVFTARNISINITTSYIICFILVTYQCWW